MIDTSQEFIDTMRNRIVTTSARVNILNSPGITTYKYLCNDIEQYLLDNKYIEDLGYAEENKQAYNFRQINNTITQETGNYAIFEGDGILLDGSVNALSSNATNVEIGYMSDSLSDEQGNFSTPIEITIINNFRDSEKINIVFSKTRKEYPKNFQVIARKYDEDDPTQYVENITSIINNTNEVVTIDNYSGGYITIKIDDWNIPNARAKICDIYYGVLTQYEDNKIISINGRKGIDLTNESIESKELTLKLLDENSEYNIFEPSGTFANLNKNARVSIEFGVLINNFIYYVLVDEYVLTNPIKEDNELEITLTGIGRINQYSDTDFLACYYDKHTLYELLSGYAGFDDENHFEIDEKLKRESLAVRTQYGSCSFTTGVRKLATALRCNIIETIDNNILFKRIEETEPVSTIELENMMNIPTITKKEKPSNIKMSIYTPKITENNIVLVETDVFELTKDFFTFMYENGIEHSAGPYTATVYYMWFNSNTNQWEVVTYQDGSEFSFDITNAVKYQDNYCIFNGYNDTGEYIKIKVVGNKVELVQSSVTYEVENGSNTKENSIDSQSIETQTQALKVFTWLKDHYKKCFEYEIEINDACTYEIGDTVFIETGIYVNNQMLIRKAIIVGIEYEYEGILTYRLKLRGA